MKSAVTLILVFISAVLLLLVFDLMPEGRVYDCGMAEWHPDIPKDVKEECRRLRYEDWRRQNPPNRSTIST